MKGHKCGALLTPDSVGNGTFYSHLAACEGRLVKFASVQWRSNCVKCTIKDEGTRTFVGEKCEKGLRNWEVITLEFAKQVAVEFWKKKVEDARGALAEAEHELTEFEASLSNTE